MGKAPEAGDDGVVLAGRLQMAQQGLAVLRVRCGPKCGEEGHGLRLSLQRLGVHQRHCHENLASERQVSFPPPGKAVHGQCACSGIAREGCGLAPENVARELVQQQHQGQPVMGVALPRHQAALCCLSHQVAKRLFDLLVQRGSATEPQVAAAGAWPTQRERVPEPEYKYRLRLDRARRAW